MNNIYHYGIKGMKWGVRKDTVNKDLKKLHRSALHYYNKVNKYNARLDAGKKSSKHSISGSSQKLRRQVDNLICKYGDAQVTRDFDPNGYTVRYVTSSIARLDEMGRVSSINFAKSAAKKYDYSR